MGRPRVLIAGGGHAGLAALHGVLTRLRGAEVVLFEPREKHLLKPRLVEWLGDASIDLELPLEPLVDSTRVQWVRAAADEVDVARGEIEADGRRWSGDWIVVASGAHTSLPKGVPKRKGVFRIDGFEDVRALRAHLERCAEQAGEAKTPAKRLPKLSVLVVGGGYVGVESSAEIALLLRRLAMAHGVSPAEVHVTLCEQRDQLFAGGVPDEETAIAVDEALARKAVDVRTGVAVRFDGGKPIVGRKAHPAATIILATGIEGTLAAPRPFEARAKRFAVDETLRVKGAENVFACGDAAVMPGAVASGQHAVQAGAHAARAIAALEARRRPDPFVPSTIGEFVTLGEGDVVGWVSVLGRRVHLAGLPAAAARTAAFARYLAQLRVGALRS